MTTHITKTWFDGEKVVTQEIPESEVYKHEPRCAVIVEVFAKDWRLDYMSLPVGKHRLYTQEYVYTTPPAAQQEPDAYGYAKRLAVAIWEQHYKATAPQWKPFDDLIGVLTQIDNMTAGLTSQRQPLTDEQRRNIVRANKMRHDSDEIDPYGVIDDVEAAHGITGEKT